jgi:predicted ATPase
LQFHHGDSGQTKLEKLQQALSRYQFPQADTVPLLAALLSLPYPEGTSPLTLSPQKQKYKTQEALVAWLLEEAERQAVYCAWEDLHWADPSTLELLTLFLDQVPTIRLLAVLTFRPDFTPPWRLRSHLTQLTLNRLGRLQVEAMVQQVAGGKGLPTEVLQQIVRKTDGVPLFVEELTKMVLESGLLRETNGHYELTGPLPSLATPATLHDSLMARLDKLTTVKEVAQIGAVLGREFSYELLRAIAAVDEMALQQALGKLVEAEVLYQRGLPPHARYVFKHALIQEAAYQSLLKSTRQQYHQQIAQVLADHFPETVETQPELVAQHYSEAGLIEQAIPYWQQAGKRASQRSANVEAVSHLTKGLELLKTLPDTPERSQHELRLLTTLGPALISTKGYGAPEVEQTYARAYELCQQGGSPRQLIYVLQGLRLFYFVRGELRKAQDLAEHIYRLAQRVSTPTALMTAHGALGISLFRVGELTAARAHLEQAWMLCHPQEHNPGVIESMRDLGGSYLSQVALILWYLGYPDQALEKARAALLLAHEGTHPFNLAFALAYAAAMDFLLQEVQAGQEHVEALIALATDQQFPDWLALGTAMRGTGLVERGEVKAGMAQLQQGLAEMQALGQEIGRPGYLADLAMAYGKQGQTEAGLRVMAEALAAVDRIGERYYEAELYREKGELTLQSQVPGPRSKDEDEAEACFLKAIEIARQQEAKSWELRASISLTRLWQQQGKKEEARQMLAAIYNWFTEGFDTADLKEAKILLEELT